MNKAGVNTCNESLWFTTGPGTGFDAQDDRTWGFKMCGIFSPAESLLTFQQVLISLLLAI